MSLALCLQGFGAGFVIAVLTTPVGVSGAVFLLPVQLSILHVPNPAVTPTNLLFNVVAGPGALIRYARAGQLGGALVRQLMLGTIPGVVVGAMLRVFVLSGGRVFRLIAGSVLLPLGIWLIARTAARASTSPREAFSARTTTLLALCVGIVGGIYGIGGGSIIGPILVGRGRPVTEVAPAALASTFVASAIGALSYVALAFATRSDVAPHWQLGLSSGVGGLLGGYLGAALQPRLRDVHLRLLLGVAAVGVGTLYLAQTFG